MIKVFGTSLRILDTMPKYIKKTSNGALTGGGWGVILAMLMVKEYRISTE